MQRLALPSVPSPRAGLQHVATAPVRSLSGTRDSQNLTWENLVWIGEHRLVCLEDLWVAAAVAIGSGCDCPERVARLDDIHRRVGIAIACNGDALVDLCDTLDITNSEDHLFLGRSVGCFAVDERSSVVEADVEACD